MPAPLSVRKNIELLTASELQALSDSYRRMQLISDNRGFNYLAGFHGMPGKYCHTTKILFLPWHRAYLYTFEQALKDQAPSATVPWWDWTSALSHESGIPAAFAAATDSAGQPNPLLKSFINVPSSVPPMARDTQRVPGDPQTLPIPSYVTNLLGMQDFIDFSNQVEDLHNRVHIWVGGDMEHVDYAAYDPLFYSHHAMIDRIWYLWQIRQGLNTIPHQLFEAVLQPFNLKVSDVLDVTKLGYEYAASQIVS